MKSNNIRSLKQRVLHAGSWTIVGYGLMQVLRFSGNLILTRLLFPEAFGLMAIIQAVNMGAHMMSDIGIGASIVQKEHGSDPVFLNTAWTVQAVRGFLLWLLFCILAWPISEFYDEPLLALMIPVVGLGSFIEGFSSTKIHTAQRNLDAARMTQIEVGCYALGLGVTVFLAWQMQTVWALVWGGVISALIRTIASHVYLHGMKNSFAWDREALTHLRGFGRWIMLSSALTFLSAEGARLLIGAMLDMRQLGFFTLATTMSLLLWQAMQQITSRVYFPAYAEIYRSNPEKLPAILYKGRLSIILPSWGLAVIFVFWGTQIMGLLYDDRYYESGIMLEQLAIGSLLACVWGSYSGVLWATGKVAATTALTACQVVCQLSAIFIGFHLGGNAGVVLGVAASNWLLYPINAFVMHRYGYWQPKIDLLLLAASILVAYFAWPGLI